MRCHCYLPRAPSRVAYQVTCFFSLAGRTRWLDDGSVSLARTRHMQFTCCPVTICKDRGKNVNSFYHDMMNTFRIYDVGAATWCKRCDRTDGRRTRRCTWGRRQMKRSFLLFSHTHHTELEKNKYVKIFFRFVRSRSAPPKIPYRGECPPSWWASGRPSTPSSQASTQTHWHTGKQGYCQ